MSAPEPYRSRTATPDALLARMGFRDREEAVRRIALPPLDLGSDPDLIGAFADTGDPDLALAALTELAEVADAAELRAALVRSERFRRRLIAVLGSSQALGQYLLRHPADWKLLEKDGGAPDTPYFLRAAMLEAVGANADEAEPVAEDDGATTYDRLRVEYRRWLLRLAARDLTGASGLEAVSAELADLAAATLEAALAIARAGLPDGAPPCRLAVIGMGKCGGRELNYVSDVDVVFVAEPWASEDGEETDEASALRTATQLASAMMKACSASTAEGTIWPVDAALRPEGKQGPLVRTLASHVAYYERWAKTWEFQALLKARPVAGDRALGTAYMEAVSPMVWKAANRENFVADVQAMRKRVEATMSPAEAERQIKLGPGGLRDVEFAVQLLQMVHGRADDTLHSGTTLSALAALSEGGYVGREDAARLEEAYRFLRTLEHRIQLYKLWRTHVLPEGEADMRRLGRAMGLRGDPSTELTETWRKHAHEVRRLHEKLFYRPLLMAVSRVSEDETRLTTEAARARLSALGYADPAGALRHLEALTSGVSRRASIQRQLLPAMLGWFADAADPDAGLLAFRQVSDALGSTPWYLRLLRDEGMAAERLAHLLASSRFTSELLQRAPEAIQMLADDADLKPRDRAALLTEVHAGVARAQSPESAAIGVRAIRRREQFRIAAADALGLVDVTEVCEALTAVVAATLSGALAAATAAVVGEGDPVVRMAVIALGRLGGHEMSYASDADVLFVHEPLPFVEDKVATDAAHAIANEMRRLLKMQAPEPPLEVDADLRPEGRNGPLVRSLQSYEQYYSRWSSVWESQALLRAEFVAGDADLADRFLPLIDTVRYPAGGLTEDQVREIRRIKARVETERMPRGADPSLHTKLGRGGLADVEWVAQLLQLQHGAAVETLRTTRTLEALSAARDARLLAAEDAAVLTAAWKMATRIRNAIMLVRGRPADSPPTGGRELSSIARIMGYPAEETGRMLDDYRRLTRRARGVVERVFYG
ncbi:MAG TPA: bifunctional [glutamine synthetase] adenylyltransferase/[glutamine synthetase]-adenylyl-L-tyrosine phosphorylase [Sporichthya sp.]|nr:bifunctional [glutamine synthetase] adenylyltransferase/[glutamine synthetase]-adenylyl-L-tyrosine phosphorylase [Sporichthya sp.]